jgi:hypothetical protein
MYFVIVCMFGLVGCGSDAPKDEKNDAFESTKTVVFDSGRGTGPYDYMTYAEYKSEILFTPQANMTVSSIRPDMSYCNGTCSYTATIQDESQSYLASLSGSITGDNIYGFDIPVQRLDSVVQMNAGTTYRILLDAWTTKSVGIYTTGSRTTGIIGQGIYSIVYGRSMLNGSIMNDFSSDRGGISFQLLD